MNMCTALTCAFVTAAAVSAVNDRLLTFSGSTMGTAFTIRVVKDDDSLDSHELETAIVERLEQIDGLMSTWREESELSRFNRHPSTDEWFSCSAETAEVVAAGIRLSEVTGGAFDLTVGPLVSLWQFGPAPHAAPPTPEEIAATRKRVGPEHLQVRVDPPALRKFRRDVEIDLSGIAKGYCVDEIARLLEARGHAAYLVEIGGEIRAEGNKPDGSGWIIGIESPTLNQRGVQRRIEFTGQSLATSGDYRNFREASGRRWSHIIDPRTARPVEHSLASVTVISETCMECDALATALLVMGSGRAYDWAQEHHVAALLIDRVANQFVERATPEFVRAFPAATVSQPLPEIQGSMITTFLLTLLIVGLAMAAMAVGLFARRQLRGSCGNLANLRDAAGHPICDACHDPPPNCQGAGLEGTSFDACDQKAGRPCEAGNQTSNAPVKPDTSGAP